MITRPSTSSSMRGPTSGEEGRLRWRTFDEAAGVCIGEGVCGLGRVGESGEDKSSRLGERDGLIPANAAA